MADALPPVRIRAFEVADEAAAVALWRDCGLVRPWNDPHKDITRKLLVQPELFLVATVAHDGEDRLVGTAMAGYDGGHRGSVYYLALGLRLMAEVEERLLAMGCPKTNVPVRTGNAQVLGFYDKLGYERHESFSLGKRLIPDI